MASTVNNSDTLTRREALYLIKRLRRTVIVKEDVLCSVLLDLSPADIEVLETLTGITKQRRREYTHGNSIRV